jgi:UDP-N-acetylmuramoyl-tripeptide--D-alanyl-D-alanine ligase
MQVPPGRKLIRVGASAVNDACYENAISAWPQMLRFTAVVNGERQEIRTRLLGTHWIGSILACIAVARQLGVPFDQVARVIGEVTPYPGRMQVVRLPSGGVVIRDEFKGSRHTIAAAFEELRKARAQRKFLVFCDEAESSLGPRDRLGKIGRTAAELFDYTIFIGENAHHGVAGACKGGQPAERALAFADYLAAAEFLKPVLGPGDVVLLKAGRNNQLPRLFYSLLGEVRCTIPFCSRPMVCDDCPEFRNPELVQWANEQLTVKAD